MLMQRKFLRNYFEKKIKFKTEVLKFWSDEEEGRKKKKKTFYSYSLCLERIIGKRKGPFVIQGNFFFLVYPKISIYPQKWKILVFFFNLKKRGVYLKKKKLFSTNPKQQEKKRKKKQISALGIFMYPRTKKLVFF